jgi:Raf kinase inhibitor-like YbhB/YbcL family protein
MQISSPAFQNGAAMPSEHTCDGPDLVPPLAFTDVPKNARSLALIMDDPDAPMGLWVHWLVWNIPPNTTAISKGQKIPYAQGTTSWNRPGYGGPCPPSGTHRYFFKLYALDTVLDLKPSARKPDLERAMSGHVLAEAQLMGTYKRR